MENFDKNKKNLVTSKLNSLPHSNEAEIAVISTIMTEPSIIFEYASKIRSEYFYIDFHKQIIDVILELATDNKVADIVIINERLRLKNLNTNFSNYEPLHKFMNFLPDSANFNNWLEEIIKYWKLRQMLQLFGDFYSKGRELPYEAIDNFLQEVEATLTKISDEKATSGLRPASTICAEAINKLENIALNPGAITGVPTGFIDLDAITSGFQPSDLIIIAARPAMGKTSLALNFAANAAIGASKQVAFFSLEMSSEQLMHRLLSTSARITAGKFRNGKLDSRDLERLFESVQQFTTDKIMIDDTAGINIFELSNRCRKMKREKGFCDLIIIDYLQLMSAGAAISAKGSREREISYISMGLKNLAKELSCPVIALAQLNRGLEQRPDKRPRPSDLRESGSIEQDADQIIFVYRDEVYHKDSQDKGIAEIIIGKNRHGPIDTVKLMFQDEFTAFHNLAKI